jgi:hypothetical protein
MALDNIVFQDGDIQNFMLTTAQTMTGAVGNIVTESNSNAGMMEINIPKKAGYPRGRIVNA